MHVTFAEEAPQSAKAVQSSRMKGIQDGAAKMLKGGQNRET
jgi:hypothetical protein